MTSALIEREMPALKRKPGRPRQPDPAYQEARFLADRNLNFQAWVLEQQRDAERRFYTEPAFERARIEFVAACEIIRDAQRQWQRVKEYELYVADRMAA